MALKNEKEWRKPLFFCPILNPYAPWLVEELPQAGRFKQTGFTLWIYQMYIFLINNLHF